MKITKATGTLSLAILACLGSPLAAADDFGNWYGGVGVGQASAQIDDDRIIGQLLAGGFTTTSMYGGNDRGFGYKAFGGYRFNRYFAVEGGYFHLGKFGFLATTVPAGTLRGYAKFQGVNLDAVGIWPVTDKFSVLGRIGVTSVEAKDRFIGGGLVLVGDPSPKQRGTNYKFGAGIQYDFSDDVAMRLEAERYRVDDAVGNKGDIDLLSLGLVIGFGGSAEEPEREVMAMPVAKTCADLDDDGDGINNCNDKCPGSMAGQAMGPDGCPLPAPEPEPVLEPKPFKG